ncbi:MAG: thioester domain-containing protein, partial [Stackebrandtia sp.]
ADGQRAEVYCIDLHNEIRIGVTYTQATWGESEVPNVGYVARILNDYYPNSAEPASLTSDDERAAAVQAAIWFFTDRYVLASDDPLFETASDIVTAALSDGPLPEPKDPTLDIVGPSHGRAGDVIGPFTVKTSAPTAELSASGAKMYADKEATTPIDNGTSVDAGTSFYIKSDDPARVELRAKARLSAPTGSVFVYRPTESSEKARGAQKLILASEVTVKAETKTTVDVKDVPVPTATAQLPVTGHSVLGLTAGGLSLLVIGGAIYWRLARTRRPA